MKRKNHNRRPTALYVIKAGEFYKVGISVNHEKRIETLSAGNPEPTYIKLLYVLPSEDSETIEKRIHEKLQDYSIRGEWFRSSDEEIQRAVESVITKHGYDIEDVKMQGLDGECGARFLDPALEALGKHIVTA